MPNKLDNRQNRLQVSIGPCKWIFDENCPNPDIKFYLYTQKNPQDRQLIHIDETWEKSNLSDSHFNPNDATKIILHGYNSDMFLTPLIQMKGGSLFSILLMRIAPQSQNIQSRSAKWTHTGSETVSAQTLWNSLDESFCSGVIHFVCAVLLKMYAPMVLIVQKMQQRFQCP